VLVDTDELIDSAEVAGIVGLTSGNSVRVYMARYADFPQPVIRKPRSLLWQRSAVERWAKKTGRLTS
jgi:glutathione-regulated potassium-efflux system ancillary protein KefG